MKILRAPSGSASGRHWHSTTSWPACFFFSVNETFVVEQRLKRVKIQVCILKSEATEAMFVCPLLLWYTIGGLYSVRILAYELLDFQAVKQ